MSCCSVQEGNVGTVFVFTVRDAATGAIVDLSTAGALVAKFRPGPKGVTQSHVGVFTTDGTDGKFQYVSQPGDLVPAHECWQRQGAISLPSGDFETEVRTFAVKPNI